MAISIRVTQSGSDFAEPGQYTAQSPSFDRYRMTATFIAYGDTAPTTNAAGIVGNGFIAVEFHSNNQWKTGKIYTTQTGAQLAALVNA